MKSFVDEQRDRQEERAAEFGEHPFEFRPGEVFYVHPNPSYSVIKSVVEVSENTESRKVFGVIERATLSLIQDVDDAHERFLRLCSQTDFPVTFQDLLDLMNWLLEEQTGRPPTPAVSSSTPSNENGTRSTELSSIRPVEV